MNVVETISANMLDTYAKGGGIVVIDLRTPEEYSKSHYKGAINIPYEELEDTVLPKNKLLIFYCQRGSTSLFAAREWMKKGYRTKSVIGGIRSYQGSNLYFASNHSRME